MAEQQLPLLLLGEPTTSQRPAGRPQPVPQPRHPTPQRQVQRLAQTFDVLQQAFAQRLIQIQDVPGIETAEQVLVLETIGDVRDFEAAVRRIAGLEWLFDVEDKADPDADFFYEDRHEKSVERRLFLVSSNATAVQQLVQLWDRYKLDPASIPRGFRKWKSLFDQLKTLRYWDETDRLTQEALDYWRDELASGAASVRFEIEVWFSSSQAKNDATRVELAALLQSLGGQVLSWAEIGSIRYLAALVELPAAAIQNVLDGNYPQLVFYQRIMYFEPMVRGMCPVDVADAAAIDRTTEPTNEPPIVALLDGLPLQNHALLAGRLLIDDPDGWEPAFPAGSRKHGTAMASLIIHGDLNGTEQPIRGKLYVRPVLRPDANGVESTPTDVLLVDLFHRAVRRLFEGDGAEGPVAPTIQVVNLSIGDAFRLFSRQLSPWARLLDWLSWKYGVLFCVSAGNDDEALTLGVLRRDFAGLTREDVQREVLAAMLRSASVRVLLNPAESINAVSVGAAYLDASNWTPAHGNIEVFTTPLPAPYSRSGPGYGRAVKPDVLFPGGRRSYRERAGPSHEPAMLTPFMGTGTAPGQKAAVPGQGGQLNAAAFLAGTSNATALATRQFARLWEAIQGNPILAPYLGDRWKSVSLIKSLLIHGASWGEIGDLVEGLVVGANHYLKKDSVAALAGFGIVDVAKGTGCTEQRATLVAAGSIRVDEMHEYRVPLPPSLSGTREWRRLTITLAWITPIVPSRRAYRAVRLNVKIPVTTLGLAREDASHVAVDRGTVQHEVLEGAKAVAFVDGDALVFTVECRGAAAEPAEPIPYGLCVSLEVAQGVQIPVYNEIRARVQPAIQVAG